MRKIQIGQIGVAHDHAKPHLFSVLKQNDIYDFVGIADRDFALLNERCKLWGVDKQIPLLSPEELLEGGKIKAVLIETDELNAVDYAIKAVERGIAVHLDKPGFYEYKDFEKLIGLAKEKNVPVHMGYMYRYNPIIKKCFELKNQGLLGEIFSIEAQMSVGHPKEKREWLSQFKGGMMYFLGCHLIDLILQFQGAPDSISSDHICTGIENEKECEDFSFATFKYHNGISFIKVTAAETNGYIRRQFVITGSKGTVEIKPLEIHADSSETLMYSQAHITLRNGDIDPWHDSGHLIQSETFDRYDEMMKEFAQIVNKEIDSPYSYDYELLLAKTIYQCCGRGEKTT